MKSKSFVLGSFLGLHAIVACASPQGFAPGIFPPRPSFANTTRPSPTPTPTVSACDSECSVLYPRLSAIQWVPEVQVVYTTTITVATLFLHPIVTANSTYTQLLVFNSGLPKDYNSWTIWPNTEGTAVVTFPVTRSTGVFWSHVAYPTPYLDYAWEYNWQGVLQTHDKEFVPACETVAPPELYAVPLAKEHPDYPQPKGPLGPGKADPSGNGWVPVWAPYKDEPDALFFQVAFPSESAFATCESASQPYPLPTEYTTAKYVTQTVVVNGSITVTPVFSVSPPFVALPTATGFSDISMGDPNNVGVEKTATGFETTPPWGGNGQTLKPSSAAAHLESSAPNLFGPGNPQAHQTDTPEPGSQNPPNLGDIIASAIKNNGGMFLSGIQAQQSRPAAPAQFAVAPTPTFTYITTDVNGQPTTMPAFILPGSGATATIGQSVTINGQATVLSAPPPIFTSVTTTINGVATVIPAYIINGTSTATLGQTVVINGQTTVLTAPTAVLTWVPTTVNGKPTSILVYETPGLSAAPTGVVSGSTTNSANAKTSSADSMTGSGTPPAAATTTKSTNGAAAEAWRVSWSAVVVGLGAFALILL